MTRSRISRVLIDAPAEFRIRPAISRPISGVAPDLTSLVTIFSGTNSPVRPSRLPTLVISCTSRRGEAGGNDRDCAGAAPVQKRLPKSRGLIRPSLVSRMGGRIGLSIRWAAFPPASK